MRVRIVLALACAVLFSAQVRAHHTTGSNTGGGGQRNLLMPGGDGRPAHRFGITQDFSVIDNSVGELWTFTPFGEFALSKRFALSLALPVSHLRRDTGPDAWGIGDISLGGNYLLLDKKISLTLFTGIAIPTGNEYNGLGRGAFSQESAIGMGTNLGKWRIAITSGINFGYESDAEPLALIRAVLISPGFAANKLQAALSVNGIIFLASDTFSGGSAKIFVEPQLIWSLNKNLKLNAGGRIAVADTLATRSGVNLTQLSNSLISDVRFGAVIGFQYTFGAEEKCLCPAH